MATTEIEKLERRYAENPQGLTFAPLAEIHRKNGDVARALELLQAGLELHPNYIPASIVLGRCHWDQGDLPAAEAAFSHVLRLDDENVIALKSLADINERLERFSEAQRWLNRLISVDRSNEEARVQLARIQSAKQEPSAATVPPHEIAAAEPERAQAPPDAPVAAEATIPSTPGVLDLTAAIAEPAPSPISEAPAEPTATQSPKLEFLDIGQPDASPVPRAEEPASEEPAAVDGLISQEFVPPKDSTYRLHPELTREFAPDSGGDELEVETAEEVELQSSGASEFRVPNAAEDLMDFAAAAGVLRQEALEAPRAPPEEPAPAAGLPDPRPVSEPERQVGAPVPESPVQPARSSYSVRDTRGQSVGSFFQTLLAARPPGNAGAPLGSAAGPPTVGAGPPEPPDAPALSPQFGDEALPAAPAVSASGSPPDADVSFDDFFGAAAAGSSPRPDGSTEPRKDDLDQFQSWLQNLKR